MKHFARMILVSSLARSRRRLAMMFMLKLKSRPTSHGTLLLACRSWIMRIRGLAVMEDMETN